MPAVPSARRSSRKRPFVVADSFPDEVRKEKQETPNPNSEAKK
jgi:hypothetical protein